MTTSRTIIPVNRPLAGTVRPPGSKSLTNRALIIAALARGPSRLSGVLDSDDTRVMIESLRRLGLTIEQDLSAATVSIDGRIPPPAGDVELWLENSGTSIRFLTAACAVDRHHLRVRLDGNARMRERPIQPLVDALNRWGANVSTELGTGCPPVIVQSTDGLPGGTVTVAGDLSSQFLSALLMAAPCAREDVTLDVTGPLVSRPYVDMTLAVMRDFAAEITEPEPNSFHVRPTGYQGRDYAIEPDASAASYFFAAAALTGGQITVQGLSRHSLQGDIRFVDVLGQMGCRVSYNDDSVTVEGPDQLNGIDVDMNDISDTAQTLAAIAPFASGTTRIRNVAHMRLKETDRVTAVVNELRKLGITVDEHEDGMTIHPGPMQPASIDTYDDHRMAMSFAITGLRQPGVTILDPGCTSKTYPRFFDDLDALCQGAR